MALCNLEKEQLGIVMGPRINEERACVELEVNVRVLEGEEAVDAIDSVYAYKRVSTTQFVEDLYPEIVEAFEDTFTSSQLQYYWPG